MTDLTLVPGNEPPPPSALDGLSISNGTNPKRVRARIGSETASQPVPKEPSNETEVESFVRPAEPRKRVRGRVGSGTGLTGQKKPDLRGVVPKAEQERLRCGFGVELRRLRTEAGLTQARTSDLAGLSGDHVGRLERGQRRPTVQAIKVLARIVAPAGEREAVEQRLAGLAGTSLREGAERKKQLKTNKGRREALADLERMVRKLDRAITRQEAAGQVVSGSLRLLAQRVGETAAKARADLAASTEPEGIPGHVPIDSISKRPPRKGRKEILQWWVDQSRISSARAVAEATAMRHR